MINLLKKYPFKKNALPLAIPLNFFGLAILGPIETNIGGSGKPLVWPTWNPTSWRAIDNYGGVPPSYTYTQGVSGWSQVETSDGTYDWSLFDLVWPKLISKGVTNVLMSFQAIPQWASVGNAYSFSCTITSASPGVVTATGNNFANGWKVFFTGGTVPTGLSLNTVYYVVSNGVDGTGKFRLSATSGGAAINTSGSAGTSTITALDSQPANMAKVTNWVTSYLTRATLDGLPIKYVEGPNEANNGVGFYVGTVAELVTLQRTIYNAAKAYDPTIQVLTPPMNSLGTSVHGPGSPSGGIDYLKAFLQAGGGAYADIIAWHGYPPDPGTLNQSLYASTLASFIAMLATQGQSAKPLWNTEYSGVSGVPATDETYLAATTFIDWSYGVARKYYYAYEQGSPSDILWSPPNVSPPNGALNAAGIAYANLVSWLTGAKLISALGISGVIWSVNLILSSGAQALAVWTSDGSTPNFSVPNWATQYKTLAGGTVTGLGATVVIGGNPLLFM